MFDGLYHPFLVIRGMVYIAIPTLSKTQVTMNALPFIGKYEPMDIDNIAYVTHFQEKHMSVCGWAV